ncbi:TniQ family protein [Caldifermentibacillus hisashii]|uniref:TniQ family protein n=1 Tax=Caldifermentibacillus hisashii TaxID=996558 RepID=UPI002E24C562|nr:TniQ family protein [Caldifermentibacillus hisashii]
MEQPIIEACNDKKTTQLYNLKPIGIGTPYIESLTSYIIRLAAAHNFTPGNLIGKIITPLLNKNYLINTAVRGGGGLYKSASALNGIKSSAIDLVKSLEVLTLREDLELLTMLTWSKVLPTRGLMRSHKAWCPVCYEEWKKNDQVIYEPLIWFIEEVKICTRHKVKLETYCSYCAKEIPTLSRNSQHGYCSNCSRWLGGEKDFLSQEKEINFLEVWKAKNIGELLESMAFIKGCTDESRIQIVLKKAVMECTDGKESELIKLLDVPKSTYKSWVEENKRPSLYYLLKVSCCLGITLKQLLTDDLTTIAFNFQPMKYPSKMEYIWNQRFPDGYIVYGKIKVQSFAKEKCRVLH